jgi:hypothetical protein
MRVKWTAIYPNPPEISRNKYYEYKINDNSVQVFGDGLTIDYTIEQFKEFFSPELETWNDILKETKKKDKI